MTNDERRNIRQDAQVDLAKAMKATTRAMRRLSALTTGSMSTHDMAREVTLELKKVMEFNHDMIEVLGEL